MYRNGAEAVHFHAHDEGPFFRPFAAEAALNLEKGDEVHFEVNCRAHNVDCIVANTLFYVFGQRVQV